MATWVKTSENNYIQIAQIIQVSVFPDSLGTFSIQADFGKGDIRTLRSGFLTQAAAQTALDNSIVNLGGSI